MPSTSIPLLCQRDLFSIPDGHCYLNSAFMGPLPRPVEQAGVATLAARASPIGLTPLDFFEPAERTRKLCAQLVNSDPERVAFVPTAAYAMAIVAKNLRPRPGQNVVMLGDMFPSNTMIPSAFRISPMRIAYIIVSKGYGGLERHQIELANAMVARHEVFVIADPSFASALDPAINHLPFDATTWRYNPLALWRLRRILKKIQPDVIHAQANKAAYMANLCGVRATINVATVHNQKNDIKPFGRFDGVIAVSTAAGARLDHPHIAIIPNGITTPPLPEPSVIAQLRAQWCPANEPMTIAVGRLVAAKGFDILLQAWRDLPGKLIIIGSGPDEGKLKNLHAELALGERVVFTGYRKDVPLFMAAADLLVIASRREGFPYVLIEALHTGIPIISTDIPGAAEFLPPDAVIRTEDPLALHSALQKALGQHEVLKHQYQPNFIRARTELSLTTMVDQTVNFYQNLLAHKQN